MTTGRPWWEYRVVVVDDRGEVERALYVGLAMEAATSRRAEAAAAGLRVRLEGRTVYPWREIDR